MVNYGVCKGASLGKQLHELPIFAHERHADIELVPDSVCSHAKRHFLLPYAVLRRCGDGHRTIACRQRPGGGLLCLHSHLLDFLNRIERSVPAVRTKFAPVTENRLSNVLLRAGRATELRLPNKSRQINRRDFLFGGHMVIWFWLDRRGDSGLHEGRCV